MSREHTKRPRPRGVSLIALLVTLLFIALATIEFSRFFTLTSRGINDLKVEQQFQDLTLMAQMVTRNQTLCDQNLTRLLPQTGIPQGELASYSLELSELRLFDSAGTPGAVLLERSPSQIAGPQAITRIALERFYRVDNGFAVASLRLETRRNTGWRKSRPLNRDLPVLFTTETVNDRVRFLGCGSLPPSQPKPIRALYCTNPQSDESHPDKVPECVTAAQNAVSGRAPDATPKVFAVSCHTNNVPGSAPTSAITWSTTWKVWTTVYTTPAGNVFYNCRTPALVMVME